MDRHYFNPASVGGFGGVKRLAHAVKNESISATKHWLEDQRPYQLHYGQRPPPIGGKVKNRRKTYVPAVNFQWQADLVDVHRLASDNDDRRYLLTIIDCFSRYAFVKSIKSKNGQAVSEAFRQIFDEDSIHGAPRLLQTDKGREFYNRHVQMLLKSHGTKLFSSESIQKAALVERFNRTLRNRMWTYFSHTNHHRYLDVLNQLVDAYNRSPHSSLPPDTTPQEVWLRRNDHAFQQRIYHHQYGDDHGGLPATIDDTVRVRASLEPLTPGDFVRLARSRERALEDRGYQPRWTEEIFVIKNQHALFNNVYRVEDRLGEEIKGSFYREELKHIKQLPKPIVERVLRRNRKRGTTLVKWLGYPKKFNSEIPLDQLNNNDDE